MPSDSNKTSSRVARAIFFFFFYKGQFLRFTNTKVQHCHYRRLITVEEAALSVFSFWPFFLLFRTPHRTPKWTFSCYSSDVDKSKVHVKAARCHSDGFGHTRSVWRVLVYLWWEMIKVCVQTSSLLQQDRNKQNKTNKKNLQMQ